MLFSRKKNDQETVPAVDAVPDGTPVIEVTGSLETAIDGVEAVLATKRQVQGAVCTARQEIATFDAELAAARERLATVEAQAAMGGESDQERQAQPPEPPRSAGVRGSETDRLAGT